MGSQIYNVKALAPGTRGEFVDWTNKLTGKVVNISKDFKISSYIRLRSEQIVVWIRSQSSEEWIEKAAAAAACHNFVIDKLSLERPRNFDQLSPVYMHCTCHEKSTS